MYKNTFNDFDDFEEPGPLTFMGMEEDTPEWEAFREQLGLDLKEWMAKPKTRFLDPAEYKSFSDSVQTLAEMFHKRNPHTKISYKLDDAMGSGCASITVETPDYIDIREVGKFAEAVKKAMGIDIVQTTGHHFRITISFRNLYQTLQIGDD